jgi:hypothetical protein
MEANLDRSEIITKQSIEELTGDTLLQAEYSINNENKSRTRSALENVNESSVLNRPMTPVHLRQSMMLQTKPFDLNEMNELNINENNAWLNKNNRAKPNFKSDHNGFKRSTNILVINSDDMSADDFRPPPGPSSQNAGFASRPRIQRTPDTNMATKTKYDSINTNLSIQTVASSTFTPKYSITEPRPSSANSIKSTKSPSQSNASTLK